MCDAKEKKEVSQPPEQGELNEQSLEDVSGGYWELDVQTGERLYN